MAREATVRVSDREEWDECMAEHCRRPARDGMEWARYCSIHERHARPTDGVETMGYVAYRRLKRGEEV
jgi:hypothetical protein